MRLFHILNFCFFISLTGFSQTANTQYDSILAKKLGADDYGMKKYVFCILTTGTNDSADKSFINEAFSGHMANIKQLVSDGRLIIAGPMGQNDLKYRGIFIFNVETTDEAKILVESDPAVKAKLLGYELFEWYGSAALPEYIPVSEKIWKTKF